MKIVFISNILNHHQIKLCEAFLKKCDSFHFVATEKTGDFGYQNAREADFVLHYYNKDEKDLADKLIFDADVVIYGACDSSIIEKRIMADKLTFLYSERLFKKGVWRRWIPMTRKKVNRRILRFKDKNLFVLCASAYLSYDLLLLGFPLEKCYKWGYFPETEDEFSLKQKKDETEILWAGRMLDWKHPEAGLYLAKKLKRDNIRFRLSMVGDGPMLDKIKVKAEKAGLGSFVRFYGSLTPNEVRQKMKKADIFIATSDCGEGWGAVVNEAMSSGCAVVASHAMGSAPYLVNEETGMVFQSKNWKDLYKKVDCLIKNPEKRSEMQQKAFASMKKIWNAEYSVDNFIKLVQSFNGADFEYKLKDGPCSKA
ncbi:MAG: glycosyltransferase family 4 protein [Clostridia bacterium]|nr:glycosyltransferase family 4 protein [Clostridia bacterium]